MYPNQIFAFLSTAECVNEKANRIGANYVRKAINKVDCDGGRKNWTLTVFQEKLKEGSKRAWFSAPGQLD